MSITGAVIFSELQQWKKSYWRWPTAMLAMLSLITSALVANTAAWGFTGGLLNSDLTLTKADSPYLISSTIQIPVGVTLTIEPGVQIINDSGNSLFYVHGTLNSIGTESEPIRIESNAMVVNLKNSPSSSQVNFKFSRVDGKGVAPLVGATGYSQTSNFVLEDSDFLNLTWSYIWYPKSFRALRNVFTNSAGLNIGFDGRSAETPRLEHNLFLGSPNAGYGNKRYWIEAWASYGSTLVVTNNAFTGGPYTAIETTTTYDDIPLNATSNFWGTSEEQVIRDMVLDNEDGLDFGTRIDTSSFLSAPSSQTPSGLRYSAEPPAAVDSTGPQLISFSATPASINTSTDDRTVTLSGRFTDETGSWYMAFRCGSVLRFIADPDRSQYVDGLYIRDVGLNYLVAYKSTSGNNKDFSFVLEVPMNQNMSDESCTWTYEAIDDAGNRSSGSTGISFGVTNTSSSNVEAGPVALISPMRHDSEFSPGDLVSISFRVQDSNLNPVVNEEVTFTISPLWGFYDWRTSAAQTNDSGIATYQVKLNGAAEGRFELTAVAGGIRTQTSFSVVRNSVQYIRGPSQSTKVQAGQLVILDFTLLDKNLEPVEAENANFTFPGLEFGEATYTKNNNWSNAQGVVQAELQLSQAAKGSFQVRIDVNGKTAVATVEISAGGNQPDENIQNDERLLVQRAGSQVFVTSAELQGNFEIYEDGVLIDSFAFDGANQAHIVEQRVTGAIKIRKLEKGVASPVGYEMTKTLLWYQNVNLGSYSEANLGSSAQEKVSNLVNHRYLNSGTWKQRDSEVTKFICTGIYREGASSGEKLSARKKAKLACESAKDFDSDPNSQVSFFYQTKPTKAASYVGKVLVTVKGIEPFVASRIN